MKKILFIVLVSLIFSNNVYAKKNKGGASKGALSAKSAPAQQNKAATPNNQPASAQTPTTGSNAAAAPAANAPAQNNPSLLQSAMPALVGGAVGSYVGSKLASDSETEKPAEVNAEKKDDHPLTVR